MTIIWCMVPKISSTTDGIFRYFGLFFALLLPSPLTLRILKIKILKKWKKLLEILSFYMSTTNQNHMIYDSWDMERDRQNFFSFWTTFCPFTPPPINNPKNHNFEKMKKNPRDIIILHKCTITIIWQSYDIWFLSINCKTYFFVILGHFLLFYPPNSPKNENIKTWKLILDISSFYTNVPKIMIIGYTVSEI